MSDELRQKFLGSQSKKFEMLEYPELGLKVKVRGMSYAARTEMLRDCMLSETQIDMVKMVPRAIIATFSDPLNDAPIFTAADNDAILALSPEVIEKAREVVWRVIGLSVDETEKKSEGSPVSVPSSLSLSA